jgi:protein gp37
MSDLFQDAVPDEYIVAVANVMLQSHWHTFQVLTKRAERLEHLLATTLGWAAQARHIWWGVSVEDKKYGLPRIAHLQRTPAMVRFLSIEPILEDLGPIDLTGIHWAIVGGESGPGARPMQPSWVKAIKRQCDEQGTLFFFKQWGGAQKAKAGRHLNGKTYDAMPDRAVNPPPQRATREQLIENTTRCARQWIGTPLINLAKRRTT